MRNLKKYNITKEEILKTHFSFLKRAKELNPYMFKKNLSMKEILEELKKIKLI